MNLAEFYQMVSRAVKDQASALPDHEVGPELEPLATLINSMLQENKSLRFDHQVAVDYIREKINQMLVVIGTVPLRPEELDEKHLIALDPLGIISRSFIQILEHSNKTNKKLRLARDEIQAIFESVGGGLLVMDAERNILASNNRFREMFFAREDETVGRTCYEIICGNEDAPGETCCFKQMMVRGELAVQPDWRFGEKHFSVVATPIKDRSGKIVRCVVLYVDISELVEARTALDEERERLVLTLESIADGVIATDDQGRLSLINSVAEELTGWSAQEAIGQPICSVMMVEDPKAPKSCGDFFSDIMLHKESRVERLDSTILIDRQGIRRDIYLSAAPIHQQDKTITGTIVVFRDITREKRLDEELTKANRLESLGIFAGGIAHDFNNLLTGVLGNVSLAKVIADPKDKIYQLLNQTEKSTFRAKGLTQQLLTFAKGGMPIKKLISARDLIRESVEFSLRGSSILCDLKISDDLLPIEVDEGQINQVLQNLTVNSLQAMKESGGVVEVSAQNVELGNNQEPLLAPGKYVEIVITDHGPGISPKIINRIFDPFFTTKENGSGLGLATSYAIISKHQGQIRVESEEGKGATFFLYLPASKRELAAKVTAGNDSMSGSGRVMVMDDEEVVRSVTQSMLEYYGYEVELVNDGTEALAKYEQAMLDKKPFALVLMDLTIPGGMGGKEAISKLLAIDPQALVVVASGYSNDPVMADYLSYGFKRVISKPYRTDELISVVAEVIEEANRN